MYSVYVAPHALQEIKRLPGHIRQRVKRVIDGFVTDPQPPDSIQLSNVPAPPHITLCRFRIEKWRILYVIDEQEKIIDVIAVRQRPPHDYGDLSELLKTIL